jgi:hypothetical protein
MSLLGYKNTNDQAQVSDTYLCQLKMRLCDLAHYPSDRAETKIDIDSLSRASHQSQSQRNLNPCAFKLRLHEEIREGSRLACLALNVAVHSRTFKRRHHVKRVAAHECRIIIG